MTDKTEAQPEALRLAALLDVNYHEPYVEQAAAVELRRQHDEIQQLKAENANLRDALADIASGEITRSHCVGPHCTEELGVATADELSSRAAGALDWDDRVAQPSPDVGIPISTQLVTQTNRAAAAEQQVTALTQRLDMANRLNTDAREQLAQLSAREAAPDGWRLVPKEATRQMLDAMPPVEEDGYWAMYEAALSAAPPPPEREPLTTSQLSEVMESVDYTWEPTRFARAIERAHGIGTAND